MGTSTVSRFHDIFLVLIRLSTEERCDMTMVLSRVPFVWVGGGIRMRRGHFSSSIITCTMDKSRDFLILEAARFSSFGPKGMWPQQVTSAFARRVVPSSHSSLGLRQVVKDLPLKCCFRTDTSVRSFQSTSSATGMCYLVWGLGHLC